MAETTEPTTTTAPATEPAFKIIASGTHATQATGGISMDAPPPPGPAETAPPAAETPASTDTPPASPATSGTGEPPKANTAILGSSKPNGAAEPAPATTPAASAPPPAQSWEDMMKANGFDEQFINLAKVYKQEGNISRYAEAMSTDFTKMPAEQIHRLNIEREYPEATPEQLDLLYESEVRDKYKLDAESFDPESKEAKAAKVKMEMDAAKLRAKFAKENESLKLPSKDVQAEFQQQQEEAIRQQRQKQDEFLNLPYSKSVLTDKKIVLKDLGPGIPDFTMELADPNELTAIMTDPQALAKYQRDANGNPDPEANFQIAAFTLNRKAFCQALINQGKMLGKEELVEEAHNPPKPVISSTGAPSKESLNEAFANRGKNGRNGG